MSKCPECGEVIERLVFNWTETVYCTEDYNNEEGYTGDTDRDTNGDIQDGIFLCPECGAEVACNETEADEILKPEEKEEENKGRTNPNNNIILAP